MPKALTATNLTISYGSNTVIENASFSIDEQDFVCIVGANGSGKSTLVKAILGLIPLPSGKITFCKHITRRAIGFLPQETKIDPAFPATVFEIVLSGNLGRLGFRPFYRTADKSRATAALARLGIADLKDCSFADLSGGQKQKVLLARAIVATTELLILDEPSNNLDYDSRQEFYRTLAGLNHSGLTIIMITHDLDADDLIGNKVLSIKDATVSLSTTADYLRSFKR